MSSFLALLKHIFRHWFGRILAHILRLVYPPVRRMFERVEASPGLPQPGPTASYWMDPASPISNRNSDPSIPLPDVADIVIIGSGITGTAVARTILDHNGGRDLHGAPIRVIMLEARDTCSGATGRNGGHISPVLYQEYNDLKKKHGEQMAKEILRFRLSHITELLAVAEEEGLLNDSQARRVDAFDAYFDPGLFQQAQELLAEYRRDLPDESRHYKVYEGREQMRALQLSPSVAGCFSTSAGAVHPYRLVTGILIRLLKVYPTNFDIFTHTPCTSIKAPDTTTDSYSIITPRGVIRAKHIVHATNGWASHLLPELRGIIFPTRAVMSAQLPRKGLGDGVTPELGESKSASLSSWTGNRSFVFYPQTTMTAFDYLTQQPPVTAPASSYPQPCGELMFGGGFASVDVILPEVGCSDDRAYAPSIGGYLSTALGRAFSVKSDGEKEDTEEVRAIWSGVLGLSSDERPWVGRIPESVTKRPEAKIGCQGLAAPGEWIAAGYSGEGMVHAWMSGKALGHMVLGTGQTQLPEVFRISEQRCRSTDFEDLIASFIVG